MAQALIKGTGKKGRSEDTSLADIHLEVTAQTGVTSGKEKLRRLIACEGKTKAGTRYRGGECTSTLLYFIR